MFRFGFPPGSWLWAGDKYAGHYERVLLYLTWGSIGAERTIIGQMQRWLWSSLHKSSSFPTENSVPGLPSETVPPEWVIGCRPPWKGCVTLGKALLFSWSNSQGGQRLRALCWQPSYNWVLRSSFLKEDPGDTLQCSGRSGSHHIVSLKVEDSHKPMIHFHGVDRSSVPQDWSMDTRQALTLTIRERRVEKEVHAHTPSLKSPPLFWLRWMTSLLKTSLLKTRRAWEALAFQLGLRQTCIYTSSNLIPALKFQPPKSPFCIKVLLTVLLWKCDPRWGRGDSSGAIWSYHFLIPLSPSLSI